MNIKIDLELDAPLSVEIVRFPIKWRNEAKSILGKVVRRVCCGVALALLAIAGLVEAVTSLALAILTSPSQLAGYELSSKLFHRAKRSAFGALMFISMGEFVNVYKDQM